MTPTIAAVEATQLDEVLPLIAGYQRFYGATPDDDRNRDFFGRFIAPSEVGLLLGAWTEGRLAGFACLYWTFSSVQASEVALLNDLYVDESARGHGVGRLLIEEGRRIATERRCRFLRWYTALDNRDAQRLYERLDAHRSAWFEYELPAWAGGT